MRVSPAESVNMHALQLPRSIHSLSLERECVASSPRVWVCVCGYADLQAECRPKHKSGSCLCPSYRHASDYHTVPLRLQGHGTASGTDGKGHMRSHTQTLNLIVMRERM